MKNKKQSKETVVLGMSGGVDSSVSALLLKKKGYNVIGAFMKNFSDTKNKQTGECSWRQDYRDAQKIASILKIPLYLFDFEKEYKEKVINPMFESYKKGLTPNPDIVCNSIIKFPLFWKKAKELGAKFIAFGHYARIRRTKKGFQLLQGKDKNKDQSYFLSRTSQEDLSHTLFPVGNYTKKEIRSIAKKNKFPNWNKHGTVGICFVGKTNMQSFLKSRIKEKKGDVIFNKKIIGTHLGTSFYTIGQRAIPSAGINLIKSSNDSQKRFYIAKKDSKKNVLVVAQKNSPLLKKKEITLIKIHKINPKLKIPSKIKARIRHLGRFYSGILKGNKFIFKKPIKGIAEGQHLVLYDNLICLGGGEIRFK